MENKIVRNIRIAFLMLTAVLFVALSAAPVGAAPALHKSSGGGSFVADDSAGESNVFMFAFNASLLDEDGNAKGQFEYHNRTTGSMLHMKIVYMEVDGDEVWLGGIVTKSVNTNAQVGHERILKLQDNGEGVNAEPDGISKLSNELASFVSTQPDLQLNSLNRGNIQIR